MRRIFDSLVLVLVAALVIFPRVNTAPVPHADQLGYFSYLPALFADRPFDLQEFAAPEIHWRYRDFPATGRTVNVWGIGPAISWLPFYAAVHVLDPGVPLDDPLLWAVCGLATGFIAIVGLLFLYSALVRRFPRWIAFSVTLATLLCTPLIVYCTAEPFQGHVLTFTLTATLLWMVMTGRMTTEQHWLVAGWICGWMMDCRPQMVVCALLPFALGWPGWRRVVLLCGGAALAFFPQMLMWHETFGAWLLNPQQAVSGDRFMHMPAVWQVLFSPRHGLFLWHPILLVGLIGLVLAARKQEWRKIAVVCLLIFGAQVVINGAGGDWWGGWAFGGRRFCDTIPLLSVGLAFLLSRAWWLVVALPLTAWWNFGLLAVWLEGTTNPHALMVPNQPMTWEVVKMVVNQLRGHFLGP